MFVYIQIYIEFDVNKIFNVYIEYNYIKMK